MEESRAGSTDNTEPTRILCLDLDGLKQIKDVADFMERMGLSHLDYIVQYSSSMGIVRGRGLSAHIFIILNKAWSPGMLKEWLIHKNFSIAALRADLSLTRTCNALKWGLDVTTCQNDKLIYIAPPILGPGVVDEFNGNRIQLVKGSIRELELTDKIPSAEANRIETEKALNELRVKEGLPVRKKIITRTQHNMEYQANPGKAIVTSIKQERGFVYLNINGGDSWGYYHPESNPEFIQNFKGEPNYKTSELLPEYWATVREQVNTPMPAANGLLYLAFRDFRTAKYYNGTWDEANQFLDIRDAKSKDQLRDYLITNKQKVPEAIADWNQYFDTQGNWRVNVEKREINLFEPSYYMQMKHKKVTKVPPAIRTIIFNAIGSDEAVFEHFMNSLACMFQYRCRTESSWVLHGVPGTGKGMTMNYILKPIFGAKQAKIIRMAQLDDKYNEFMENALLLWVDEAEIKVLNGVAKIGGDLRNYITEPEITIRRMYTGPYNIPNFCNMFLSGNENEIIPIPRGDRRFNVCPYQLVPLNTIANTDELKAAIEGELEDFASYLMTRIADREKARIPIENEAKDLIMAESETSIDQTAKALISGDFQFFWDARPILKNVVSNVTRDQLDGNYKNLLRSIAEGKNQVLFRQEIQSIFEYLIGGMPATPNKFTSMIKHYKITLKNVYRDNTKGRGIEINWKFDPETLKEALK